MIGIPYEVNTLPEDDDAEAEGPEDDSARSTDNAEGGGAGVVVGASGVASAAEGNAEDGDNEAATTKDKDDDAVLNPGDDGEVECAGAQEDDMLEGGDDVKGCTGVVETADGG